MKITNVNGREIFDSRGFPTIECELTLDGEKKVIASAPAGRSCGAFEAVELRDGGNRLMGLGVQKAIENLETIIAPMIIGKSPSVVEMDLAMIDLDGTEDRSKLGGNTMIAASMAIARAQALDNDMALYEFIADLCEFEAVTLPYPMFNIINGGMHADNKLLIQEFMIMPIGAESFRSAYELAIQVFHALHDILKEKGFRTCVGDEGGFAPDFEHDEQALDFIKQAIKRVGNETADQVVIALDVAASTFYDKKSASYNWHGAKLGASEMIALYAELANDFPIDSIEDGLYFGDWKGWKDMNKALGESLQIVGDDLFASKAERIAKAIEDDAANAAIIKPNQVGTVTEALQAIKLCKEYGMNLVVSHRSGETNDNFIVDLAVGTAAGQIKTGGCCRGERIGKYNELLRIEDTLVAALMAQ